MAYVRLVQNSYRTLTFGMNISDEINERFNDSASLVLTIVAPHFSYLSVGLISVFRLTQCNRAEHFLL